MFYINYILNFFKLFCATAGNQNNDQTSLISYNSDTDAENIDDIQTKEIQSKTFFYFYYVELLN